MLAILIDFVGYVAVGDMYAILAVGVFFFNIPSLNTRQGFFPRPCAVFLRCLAFAGLHPPNVRYCAVLDIYTLLTHKSYI